MSFNPVTNLLFVGSTKDVGLYRPDSSEKTQLERTGIKNAIKKGEWSPDGRFVAYGDDAGHVFLKDSNFEKKSNIVKLSPVITLGWSPITLDYPDLLLVVACVDQTLSLHTESGE